jgi:hypothetical protein
VTAAPSSRLLPSSPSNPCPICHRADNKGSCRYSDDGPKWLCHKGSTHHPPVGLKIGDLHLGDDFQQWAYCGESADSRTKIFTLHEEKRPALRVVEAPKPAFSLARLSPEAKPAKGVVTAGGSIFYAYSEGFNRYNAQPASSSSVTTASAALISGAKEQEKRLGPCTTNK